MPNLSQHASSENLALFAEGKLPPQLKKEIEGHLNQCDECSTTIMVYRELRDIQALGLLPEAAELPGAAERKLSGPGQVSSAAKLRAILGGVFALGGFKGMLGRPPVPSLAADSHHHIDSGDHGCDGHGEASDLSSDAFYEDVRNDGFAPSSTGEGLRGMSSNDEHHQGAGETHMTGTDHFTDAQKAFGLPASDERSDYVQQGHADTCAIQCQHLILNEFGVDVSEDQLVKEAEAKHLYSPGHGTRPEDVGKLLEGHGVQVHRELNANIFNLSNELMQGHKVIVGVDANELWHENSFAHSFIDRIGYGQANHAVIVSGIDTSDPNHVQVTVTDPGSGDEAKKYSWNEFMNAWRTSHFTMVSTTDPAPSTLPEMVNFDYHAGHIPMAGGASYEFTHELSRAVGHESDQGVVERLGSVYMSVLDGHVSMEQLSGVLGLHDGSEGFMHDLVSGLMTFAHEAFAAGATMAMLEEFASGDEESADSPSLPSHEEDSNVGMSHSHDGPFQDGLSADHDIHVHDTAHHDVEHQFDHGNLSEDSSTDGTDSGDDGTIPPDMGHHN